MDKWQEKRAIFWCDLLSPVIYGEVEPEAINQFLKNLTNREIRFPDGRIAKPSLSTARRILNRYQQGGFDALERKKRSDQGKPRNVSPETIHKAIELKKEQPRRSPATINLFLQEMFGVSIARSTLYRHLKQAHATRLKLGTLQSKVRIRWTRDHTHDLWVGDFEDGPYVLEKDNVVPTFLSAFIDCHSRYIPEARYYVRENLDILIDSFIRALSTHGTPLDLYVDNAKIYHANALKAACHRLHIRLLHRPPGDPPPGGLIERFFQTAQDQFEAEVRAGDPLTLAQLNRAFSAWLSVTYHQSINSDTGQTPNERYQKGLTAIRHTDMARVMESFLQKEYRTVHKTFSDVQINKRFYRVAPTLRGDRVQVHFDPFSAWDTVNIYSMDDQYLGTGSLHDRTSALPLGPELTREKPKHNLIDLLLRKHKQILSEQTGSVDYRKILEQKPWPFFEFAKTVAHLMGRKSGLADLSTSELEALQKCYNQTLSITPQLVKQAFENAPHPGVPYILAQLKQLIKKEGYHVP